MKLLLMPLVYCPNVVVVILPVAAADPERRLVLLPFATGVQARRGEQGILGAAGEGQPRRRSGFPALFRLGLGSRLGDRGSPINSIPATTTAAEQRFEPVMLDFM